MTTGQVQRPRTRAPADPGRWLRRAWTAVVLVPFFFLLGFAVGEGMYAVLGYDPGTGDAPVWADLVALAPVVVVVLVPCVAAVVSGTRALRGGDRRGRVPLVIGAAAGVALLVLTIVSEVGDLVRR